MHKKIVPEFTTKKPIVDFFHVFFCCSLLRASAGNTKIYSAGIWACKKDWRPALQLLADMKCCELEAIPGRWQMIPFFCCFSIIIIVIVSVCYCFCLLVVVVVVVVVVGVGRWQLNHFLPQVLTCAYIIQRWLSSDTNTSNHGLLEIAVDGRNPAPVDMVNIPLFTGFYESQVVQDFFHQE